MVSLGSTSNLQPVSVTRVGPEVAGVVFLVLSCVGGIIQNEYNSQCRRGQIVLALHYQPLLSRHDSVTWTVRSNEFTPSKKNNTPLWVEWIGLGLSPLPVTVNTRIVIFLVGDPYKPSFATVTGRGNNPR